MRRRRPESDFNEEIESHLAIEADRRREEGLSEDDARHDARRRFGNVTAAQERFYERSRWAWLDGLVRHDIRYSLRRLVKSKGFTLGAGTVLALGIGATTAVFSVVNTVLLQPLAYPNADRIVSIEMLHTDTGRTTRDVSGPDFLDWQDQRQLFERIAHHEGENDLTIIVGGQAEFTNAQAVSPDFFAVFGQTPIAGRLLTREDQKASVVVVSHQWAETHFGSPQAALGKSITVYRRTLEIVGVAAPGFHYPDGTDVWGLDGPTNRTNRARRGYRAVGQLKPGIELAAAQSRMRAIGDRLAAKHPENRQTTVALVPLQDRLTADVHASVWVLMGTISLVLVIACANIANLLLARAASRVHEIALRSALGAGRARVIRQLLMEGFMLALVSAAAGVALAYVLIGGLVALAPSDLPRLDEVRIDGRVLVFTLGLSVVSTLLFGLVPALHASRLDLSDALKQGKAEATGGRGRVRAALVVVEIALSVMLLSAAGLLLRSFQVLHQTDLGFNKERVVVAYTQHAARGQEGIIRRSQFYRALLERVRALPGVAAASGVVFAPLWEPAADAEYVVQGREEAQAGPSRSTEFQTVTPGYFSTLRIPMRAGRDFGEADGLEQPPVAIINDSLARSAFPNESPIGKRIAYRFGKDRPPSASMEIVGVVGDTRRMGPSKPPEPELFVAAAQHPGEGSLSLLVRTTLDEQTLASTLRTVVKEADATVPVRIETMDDLFAKSLAYPRFRTQLIGAFAGLAALLAATGIFSVLSYLVGQRTKELAVRMALGARASDVIRLIVGQSLRLVVVGLAVGLAGALALARLLEGLLYEISPWDVGTYLGVTAVLGLTAMLATVLPAIRGATIDSYAVLRRE